jgi:D-glycero-D-manno-heptose 1,7-bisphosphate phosphatase
MRGQKKNLKSLCIGKDWTLFLDRDGVINKKIEGDYVGVGLSLNLLMVQLKD